MYKLLLLYIIGLFVLHVQSEPDFYEQQRSGQRSSVPRYSNSQQRQPVGFEQVAQRTVVGNLQNSRGSPSGNPREVVCYYHAESYNRTGSLQFKENDLAKALGYCTKIIYGYAIIDPETYKLVSKHPQHELSTGANFFRQFRGIARNVKVLLGVGGGNDDEGNYRKYFDIVKDQNYVNTFVESALQLIQSYDFDGIDLGWQFPATDPNENVLKWIWHGVHDAPWTKTEYRSRFDNLINSFYNARSRQGRHFDITMTVLPNVNSTVFYNPTNLLQKLDAVHIMAYDFYTPRRYEKIADHFAPIYPLIDRPYDYNIDFQINYWLLSQGENRRYSRKIILGVATHGRSWEIEGSDVDLVHPPIKKYVDDDAEPGPISLESGFLTYPEICQKITRHEWVSYIDPGTQTHGGAYAFRTYDDIKYGIWVSYESPASVREKADYVILKDLGGIAINEIGFDDFRGSCSNGINLYPLLKEARSWLFQGARF